MANGKSVDLTDLIEQIKSDSSLQSEQKVNLLVALQAVAPPLQVDKWIYRFVVGALGIALIITIIGGLVINLTGQSEPIPDGLIAIGSACVGAMAGLLAPSPDKKS